MQDRFNTGLVVGKFSPLHRGHQALIDHALSRCDRVLLLSWSKPELPGCDAVRREAWLEALYPQVERLVLDEAGLARLCAQRGIAPRALPDNQDDDAAQRAFVAWVCTALWNCRVDAVFTSEHYGDGFAASLQQHFSATEGAVWPVAHVCLDLDRRGVPVSGTALRANVHGLRQYLDPRVYTDFVGRIGLLGGESSGKTTLAGALAQRLRTVWAAEFGREHWEAKDGALQYDDLLHIAQVQVRREETLAATAHRWLVCDTTPLTTLLYCQDMFGRADTALHAMADRPYAHLFLCAPDFPFVQDGTRRDDAFRHAQHDAYIAWLRQRQRPFTLLTGSLQQRVEKVLDMLG
ncbi:AAA family ATPase [Stenotrophomonas sp.]|uniref:AAA family ATPase n=1 Tax=Stenotrophomonas sp. TaxID=69392 RepID=UPI0028A18E49|nr:AAA family ATPase [Stenotrophomonas sp.]